MSKGKIVALAAAAVVILAAACAAVPTIRNLTMKEPITLQPDQPAAVVEETTTSPVETTTAPVTQPADSGESVTRKISKAVNSIVTTTKSVATTRNAEVSSGVQSILEGEQIFGYKYSPDGYYYTDDKDCWQANTGYNLMYDKLAGLGAMYIDSVRVRFTYGGKDWMVQLWKGQYGYLLVGAEIGLYTAKEGTYNPSDKGSVNHYDCAGSEDWLYMQLDCYWAKNNDGHYVKAFTRPYARYWWPTGFVKGQLTKYTAPRTELKTKNRITFKSTEMADLFVSGLSNAGFKKAGSSSSLVDDSYYQSGADVWVLWSSINQEAFAS
ncbi:MAG: DUF4474 domain-containing protein [Clostridiales bacterium]|nr:DUF4474 domain-containing protein [Clostridiales bacterium]